MKEFYFHSKPNSSGVRVTFMGVQKSDAFFITASRCSKRDNFSREIGRMKCKGKDYLGIYTTILWGCIIDSSVAFTLIAKSLVEDVIKYPRITNKFKKNAASSSSKVDTNNKELFST
jgi:hypothetical protein